MPYHGTVTSTERGEQTFPSTTWQWKRVKVSRRPQGTDTARAKRGRWRHLARWPRTEKLTITVKHRGGAESWWLVEARGSQGVFPGWCALEDVMAAVFNEPDFAAERRDVDGGHR